MWGKHSSSQEIAHNLRMMTQVWDLRKMKTPVVEFGDLPNLVSTTQACFGPDDRLVITGTSADRSGQGASLVFVDLQKQVISLACSVPFCWWWWTIPCCNLGFADLDKRSNCSLIFLGSQTSNTYARSLRSFLLVVLQKPLLQPGFCAPAKNKYCCSLPPLLSAGDVAKSPIAACSLWNCRNR